MTTTMRRRPDPTAPRSWRARRWWRRLERRAVAVYEAELLADVRQLGRDAMPVIGIDANPASTAGVMRMRLPVGSLTLASVTPAAGEALASLSSIPLALADAGRYGRHWWISLDDGHDLCVVTASHLRLTRAPQECCAPDGEHRFSFLG